MAKFSEGFLQGLRGSGQRGSPTDPMLQRQAGPQYGSSDPLAKSIGGMFGMDMRTAPELITADMSTFKTQNPQASSSAALKQSILTQAKYEQDPQKQMLMLSKLAELDKEEQSANSRQLGIGSLIKRAEDLNLTGVADTLRTGGMGAEEAMKAIQEAEVEQAKTAKTAGVNRQTLTKLIPILEAQKFPALVSLAKSGVYDDDPKGLIKLYSDRQAARSKTAKDSRTSEEKNWEALNNDRTSRGLNPVPFEDFLLGNSGKVNPTALMQEFRLDKANGDLPNIKTIADYHLYKTGKIDANGKVIESEKSQRSKATDAEGFLRYTDDNSYVFPDAVATVKEAKVTLKKLEDDKKTNTIEMLRNNDQNILADKLEKGILTTEQTIAQSTLPPEIIKNMNTLQETASKAFEDSRASTSLLKRYNKATETPASGEPAAALAASTRFFGVGGEELNTRLEFNKLKQIESLKLLATGSTTEKEMEAVYRTTPKVEDSPEVIRNWLWGVAKLNALRSAENTERIKWSRNHSGDMTGYQDYFSSLTQDINGEPPPFVKQAYSKAGVPPSPSFIEKTESALK
jgi:hypothetical protein